MCVVNSFSMGFLTEFYKALRRQSINLNEMHLRKRRD